MLGQPPPGWLLSSKRKRVQDTTEDSDTQVGKDIFKGFFELELPLGHFSRPYTRAGISQRRSAFISFCDKELAFLQRVDASCCLLIVSWVYTRRAGLEVNEYSPTTLYLALHLACAYWEDDEALGEQIMHRVIGAPPRHPMINGSQAEKQDGSDSPSRYSPRKEDVEREFFEDDLPQNWQFDRKELRKYLSRVKGFFIMRDKLLHHLSFKLHVSLDEVASEMAEFPRCSLFLLDPLADAIIPRVTQSNDEDLGSGLDDSEGEDVGDEE